MEDFSLYLLGDFGRIVTIIGAIISDTIGAPSVQGSAQCVFFIAPIVIKQVHSSHPYQWPIH